MFCTFKVLIRLASYVKEHWMERNRTSQEPLWNWRDLCLALGLPEAEGPEVGSVSIDSRTLKPGSLFVALDGSTGPVLTAGKGTGHDGHSFVRHAEEQGAAGAMVHRDLDADIPLLRVADTREGLWQLGIASRARFEGVVFAITGSAGKTTAKSMLAGVTQGFATPGSLNNLWGVPLSLALAAKDWQAGVFEVGMNRPGEIAPLAKIIRPHVAAVLNALPAHLQAFTSVDEIRDEKLSICQGMETNGTLVVPQDMEVPSLPHGLRLLRFGTSNSAEVRVSPVDSNWHEICLEYGSRSVHTEVPGGGEHRALTAAAVAACAIAGGFELDVMTRLRAVQVPAGRGAELEVAGIRILDDSYNANPVSMRYAIEQLKNRRGRRLAVLGEMLELGQSEVRLHEELARQAAALDGVWCVGRLAEATFKALPLEVSRQWFAQADSALLESLCAELREGDSLLVKGSNRVFWVNQFVQKLLAALAEHTSPNFP